MSNVNNKPKHSKPERRDGIDKTALAYKIVEFHLNRGDHANYDSIKHTIKSDQDLMELALLHEQIVIGKTSGYGLGNRWDTAIRRLIFRIGMHSLGDGLLSNHSDIQLIKISPHDRHQLRSAICKVRRATHDPELTNFYFYTMHQSSGSLHLFHVFLDGLLNSLLAVEPPPESPESPDFARHHLIAKQLFSESLNYNHIHAESPPESLYPYDPNSPPKPELIPEDLIRQRFQLI
tara:strand:+ start:2595 stop:3296 length:702 start_codon:yes stop_codon:yes gene_type:complete